jgi:hypothetical protein
MGYQVYSGLINHLLGYIGFNTIFVKYIKKLINNSWRKHKEKS